MLACIWMGSIGNPLCYTWDQSEEVKWGYERSRYRRLCPELESLSMRQRDPRNILPYFMQFREPLRSLFRVHGETDGESSIVVLEPRCTAITLCINGAPGFIDSSRQMNVSPVLYGPTLAAFHRDFVLAVGEYYSTYIFLFGIYLLENEQEGWNEANLSGHRYEFHIPCPSGPEMFAWYYSDALSQSPDSRADNIVYHEYQQAISPNMRKSHAETSGPQTIWEVFTEKAPEIVLQARHTAMDNLRQRGHWRALEYVKNASFKFSTEKGVCPCDSSVLKSPRKSPRKNHAASEKTRQSSPPRSFKRQATGDGRKRKIYHDKIEDSDNSDEDADLQQRYKVCRYSTKKNGVPVNGPCITSREVEDNVPSGICWGHWQKFHRGDRNMDKEPAESHFCAVM
ncbi:dicarboxylate carrier protein [Perkinsela sp. CCAP 1560/4]|nr:dicarboxylate carrier protein [Perkinsela sp. CCAP 1560/4]|eukprot:KNH07213.1 dicarboxylate carrier protein [Perkinsela sp. CCAP 1560/4]